MSAHVSFGSHDQYDPHASFAHTAPEIKPAVSNAKPAPRHRYARLSISLRSRSPPTGAEFSIRAASGNSAASAPASPTMGRTRFGFTLTASAARTAASPAASELDSDSPSPSPPSTSPSKNPNALSAAPHPCVLSTIRNETHDSDPTSNVAYDSIITLTCIMSQLLFNAGTNADAFCSSAGSASVAAATVDNAVGAASAPGTALLENPSLSVKIRCTPVMPHARKSRDSYMFESGKWPDSAHLAARSDASATLPPSMAVCSIFPARLSSVKNALLQ
mmetsp:Transcript_3724/g.12806  ORF Transcript_3724/g.12806 Transcript_3724/m.12806 type:complete len:276 (+) Transcript_3724:233-1060(+)